MADRNQIEGVIFKAIDRVNEVLLDENAVPKDRATILLGDGAALDSMGFVNFIVALEETLEAETGLALNLVGHLNAPNNGVPKSATVDDLVEFVFRLVHANARGAT